MKHAIDTAIEPHLSTGSALQSARDMLRPLVIACSTVSLLLGCSGRRAPVTPEEVSNFPPTCEIVAPQDGQGVSVEGAVLLVARASDTDQPTAALAAVWTSNRLDEPIGSATLDTEDFWHLSWVPLEGYHTLSLTVTNDQGATCQDKVEILAKAPPQAVISYPLDGSRVNLDEWAAAEPDVVRFSGVIEDGYVAATELIATWISGEFGTLPSQPATDASGWIEVDVPGLSSGPQTITLTVEDPWGLVRQTTTTFDINRPPALDHVLLTPSEPKIGDPLTAVVVGYLDPEGDPAGVHLYVWHHNPAGTADFLLLADETEATLILSSGVFAKGDQVRVTVTIVDAHGAQAPPTTATVTIADTPPTVLVPPWIASPECEADWSPSTCPKTGYPLTLGLDEIWAEDADDDPVTATVYWYRPASGDTPLAMGNTLSESLFQKGDVIYVAVTPVADGATGATVTSPLVTILNTPPVMTSVTISGSHMPPRTQSTLTCHANATDADGDGITYTYAWEVDGETKPGSGSEGRVLDPAHFIKHQEVVCIAAPSDGSDLGASLASVPLIIANTPPTAPFIAVSPAAPLEGVDDLLCELVAESSDADGDSLTYTVTWTVEAPPFGNPISYTAATTTHLPGDTVPAADITRGERWRCRMTADDGDGGTTTGLAPSLTIGPNGFFVRTQATWNANLGGLGGANEKCLTQLTTLDWLNKSLAESYDMLNGDHIRAFLCTSDHCQNPLSTTTYQFAQAGSPAVGGSTFTSDALGRGPGNFEHWNTATTFGSNGLHYTGRGSESSALWSLQGGPMNCFNYTQAATGNPGSSDFGFTSSNSTARFSSRLQGCTSSYNLLCMVHPHPVTAAPPTSCVTPWGETVPHGESVIAWRESASCETEGCASELRVCDNGVLSGSYANEACTARESLSTLCTHRGYFVRTFSTYTGAMGELEGANAICFDEVTSHTWRDKAQAGSLTADRVEAFLCSSQNCQLPRPTRVYQLARAGSDAIGGAYFLTNETGGGPEDLQRWDATAFLGDNQLYWTGRNAGSNPYDWSQGTPTSSCDNWTTDQSPTNAAVGTPSSYALGAARRWGGHFTGCSNSRYIICMVHPADE